MENIEEEKKEEKSTRKVFETFKAIRGKNEKGEKTLNNFTLKEKLGQGSFSKVYRVTRHFDSENK